MKKYGKWIESAACKSRAHCRNCLTENLGNALTQQYDIPDECPFGMTLDNPTEKPVKIQDTQKVRKDSKEQTKNYLCSHADLAIYTSGSCGCKKRKNNCSLYDITLSQNKWKQRCRNPGTCDGYKIERNE